MGVAGKNKKIKENQMLGNLIKERLIINMQKLRVFTLHFKSRCFLRVFFYDILSEFFAF